MKKTLDTSGIVNELKGASAFFPTKSVQTENASQKQSHLPNKPTTAPSASTRASKQSIKLASNQASNHPEKNRDDVPENPSNDRLTTLSTDQSTKQSTKQSTNQSTSRSVNYSVDNSIILGRPKAFYITQKQDDDLDMAVTKLAKRVEGKTNQKIDRSTVIRLLIEESKITTDQTISRLVNRLINRLISQLTSSSTNSSHE